MSNDIATGAAAPPSAAPAPAAAETPSSSTPAAPATTEELKALAEPTKVDWYVEQRTEDRHPGLHERKSEPQRRMNKYQRTKAARDEAKAEAAGLRAEL